MGGQKAKKRVTYENDGWQCDVCSNTQTSLRRNGPNNIRMCTACYSKMQREKKKGSTDALYSERIAGDDLVTDSHHFNVRGSRHASAAARKFIEEFARNKGGWEKNDGSQKRGTAYEEDILAHQTSSRPTQEAADTILTTKLLSVPKGASEDLFHLAQSCCAAGNKILRRDGNFTSQQGMIYVTERSRSQHVVVEQRKLAIGEDKCMRISSPRRAGTHSYRHESQQPDVLQGAADLLHMMKEQSTQPGKILSARGHNTGPIQYGAESPGPLLESVRYPWSTRRSNIGCGNFPASLGSGETCSREFPFTSHATGRHMIRGVHGHRAANNPAIPQQFLDLQSATCHCSSRDVA